VLRVIEDRDADVFTGDPSGVVDPRRSFTPDASLPAAAVGVDHVTRWRLQRLHDSDRKGALLGVADCDRTVRGADGELAVNRPRLLVPREAVGLDFLGNRAPRRHEIERPLEAAALGPARDAFELS